MNGPRLFLLRSLLLLIEAIDGLAIVAIVVAVAPPLIMHFFPGPFILVIEPVQRFFARMEAPLIAVLRAFAPREYHGTDLTPALVAACMLLVCWGSRVVLSRIRVAILTIRELETVAEAEEAARSADVAGKIAAIQAASPSEREQVLEVYTQAKKILDGQRRTVSFLAVDVVNSTGMKHGEDPVSAERDFRQYRKLVESVIGRHRALKGAWTPDGVMICFSTLEDAVLAGQDLIRGLSDFNRSVKSIRADFKVRCGVNSGAVLYDDSVRMEEMSDASIDLTGHLQKYAEPDSIFAAKSVIEGQAAHLGFRPVDKKVDGIDVCAWAGSR